MSNANVIGHSRVVGVRELKAQMRAMHQGYDIEVKRAPIDKTPFDALDDHLMQIRFGDEVVSVRPSPRPVAWTYCGANDVAVGATLIASRQRAGWATVEATKAQRRGEMRQEIGDLLLMARDAALRGYKA